MTDARQANPIETIPLLAPREVGNAIWTPTGVEHINSWVVKRDEDRRAMVKHEFRFTFRGETRFFGILAYEGESQDQIEEMVGNMVIREAKRIIETLQKRGSKLVPEQIAENIPIRRELAAAMREYIRYARKRAGTTTGRIYQPGVAV